MRLEGKVAILTGGARGMGAAESRLFAAEGAKVVIADVSEAEARAVESEIAEAGGEATFVRLDVTREEDWQAAVEATVARYGKLDILVNNAGVIGDHGGDLASTDAWDELMGVNAKGVFLGIKLATPSMRKTGGGSIVNISSISGFIGQVHTHLGYNASKGAVRILTKAAAVQHAGDGIRVNSVHPGIMPPMRNVVRDPEALKQMLDTIPMGRTGEAEEVAYAVLFLASDEASYITGTELVVDGGFLAM